MSPGSRTALVTAIGIILGFVLTFFERWSNVPGPWDARHIAPVGALALGIILILVSLYRALVPHDQSVARYEATVRLFVIGISVVLLGVTIAVVT